MKDKKQFVNSVIFYDVKIKKKSNDKKFLLVITYNVQWIDHLGLFYFTVINKLYNNVCNNNNNNIF